MRTMMGAAAALALAVTGLAMMPADAQAQNAAFCAVAGGRTGYQNCGYYTFNQCREAVSGVGGFCIPNPRFEGRSYEQDAPPVQRRRNYN